MNNLDDKYPTNDDKHPIPRHTWSGVGRNVSMLIQLSLTTHLLVCESYCTAAQSQNALQSSLGRHGGQVFLLLNTYLEFDADLIFL